MIAKIPMRYVPCTTPDGTTHFTTDGKSTLCHSAVHKELAEGTTVGCSKCITAKSTRSA